MCIYDCPLTTLFKSILVDAIVVELGFPWVPMGTAGRSVGVPQTLVGAWVYSKPSCFLDGRPPDSPLGAGVRPPTGSSFEPALSLHLRPDRALSFSPVLPASSDL